MRQVEILGHTTYMRLLGHNWDLDDIDGTLGTCGT